VPRNDDNGLVPVPVPRFPQAKKKEAETLGGLGDAWLWSPLLGAAALALVVVVRVVRRVHRQP